MKLSTHIEALIILLRESKIDADKLESGVWGSGAAGVRFRKKILLVLRQLKSIRKTALETKKSAKLNRKAQKQKRKGKF